MNKKSFVLSVVFAFSPALAQSGTQPLSTTPAVDSKPLAFDAVVIKPHDQSVGPRGWTLQPTPDGYRGQNVSLYQLVQEAYGERDPKLITGGPSWIDKDKFDLEAKFDPSEIPNAKDLTFRQRGDMLRAVLADRFQLKIHFATKEFPVYNLVIAKGGPKLIETKPEDVSKGPTGTPVCLSGRSPKNLIYTAVGCRPADLEGLLRDATGRTVIDKTGLTARYDFKLSWSSDNTPANSPAAAYPSIFTAIQEQLGLKLEPATAPLDILVIDSAEIPSEN